MTNESQKVNLFASDPFAPEAPGRGDSRFVFKIPTADKPLICKIIPDPRYANGKSWYRPLRQFQYMVGPEDTDTRTKVCQSFFGNKSPEYEASWEYKKALSALKKAGKGNSIEAQKLEVLVKKFKPKDGAWLLIVEPDSPTIKAVRVSITVINALSGRDATDNVPAIPSLIKAMATEGVSPLDIGQQKPDLGWVKIYKSGQGMATRYHVEALKETVTVEHNGRKLSAVELSSRKLHDKIRTGDVTLSDIPDVVEFESKNAWTMEECETYVKSAGTVVPDRFQKRARAQVGRVDETDEVSQETTTVASLDQLPNPGAAVPNVVGLDDIPF